MVFFAIFLLKDVSSTFWQEQKASWIVFSTPKKSKIHVRGPPRPFAKRQTSSPRPPDRPEKNDGEVLHDHGPRWVGAKWCPLRHDIFTKNLGGWKSSQKSRDDWQHSPLEYLVNFSLKKIVQKNWAYNQRLFSGECVIYFTITTHSPLPFTFQSSSAIWGFTKPKRGEL